MAIMEVNHVTYRYPGEEQEVTALRDVSLTVREGEFIAVLGHNGSGKSTLAKCLNGLLLPTEGSVLMCGMDTADEEQKWNIRRNAGMVFQNPDNQLVAAIVEEDVAFGPENLGVPTADIRVRVDESLETVNMSAFAGAEPHKLSGGQKQRVAIAGILAMHPRIIILDEPTAMLDPVGRRDVMDTVCRLHDEESMTVVLITHFMEEAVLADRIVVMEDGRVALTGTPGEVFCQPERLRALGLELPAAVDLAQRLRDGGMTLTNNGLSEEALVEEICRSVSLI